MYSVLQRAKAHFDPVDRGNLAIIMPWRCSQKISASVGVQPGSIGKRFTGRSHALHRQILARGVFLFVSAGSRTEYAGLVENAGNLIIDAATHGRTSCLDRRTKKIGVSRAGTSSASGAMVVGDWWRVFRAGEQMVSLPGCRARGIWSFAPTIAYVRLPHSGGGVPVHIWERQSLAFIPAQLAEIGGRQIPHPALPARSLPFESKAIRETLWRTCAAHLGQGCQTCHDETHRKRLWKIFHVKNALCQPLL